MENGFESNLLLPDALLQSLMRVPFSQILGELLDKPLLGPCVLSLTVPGIDHSLVALLYFLLHFTSELTVVLQPQSQIVFLR